MSEQVLEQPVVQTEAEELASAMAGYGKKTRGDEPPVETPDPASQTQDAAAQTEQVQAAATAEEPQTPDPEPTVTLADELKALKAKISASSGDADEIRKLHGAVGDINRTLKALQSPAKAEAAPADDELAAALKSAEAAAEEYPEVVGPLVKALKASIARHPAVQAQPEDIDERVTTAVSRIRETDAREALMEEHPDFVTVRETPEYKTWLASKTPEFQERFLNTWNPAVVAKGLTEFKDSLKKREQKQTRLAAAVTPQGVPQKAGQSTLPDDAGFSVGYNKGRKRL
jgi:hypothetical protein